MFSGLLFVSLSKTFIYFKVLTMLDLARTQRQWLSVFALTFGFLIIVVMWSEFAASAAIGNDHLIFTR